MKAKSRKRIGPIPRKSKLPGALSGTSKIPDQPDPLPPPSPSGSRVMLLLSVALYLIWLLYLACVALLG